MPSISRNVLQGVNGPSANYDLSNDIQEVVRELEALHSLLTRWNVPTHHPTIGHKLLISQRLEIMLEAQPRWTDIKKENENVGD